ncbi:MAG: hypothetical protein AAGI91_12475 [Bacteroidota bacterium]
MRDGLTEGDFEATRNYLLKYVNVLTQSQGRQIGYALDSRFYANPPFAEFVRKRLQALTLDDVNYVLREHLRTDGLALVVVTPDAEDLPARLAKDTPSPITYNAPKPSEIMVEYEVIQQYPLGIGREAIRTVSVEDVFEQALF